MNQLNIFGTLLLVGLLAACSGTTTKTVESSVTSDQVEKRRVRLFYMEGSDTPYTGQIVESYPGGQHKSAVIVVYGSPTGAIQWFENGQKQMEASTGSLHQTGRVTEWYENGQKKSEQNIVEGRQEGPATQWYENGQMQSYGSIHDNKRVGLSTVWYENGQKFSEEIWNGGRSRCSTQWDEAGNVEQSGSESACELPRLEQASIGILPFKDMSTGNPISELNSINSITESIRRDLESRGVTVATPEQIASIVDPREAPFKIGEQLGVTHVLHGSVGFGGETIRLSVRLTLVENNFDLWSEQHRRSLDELMDIHAEIGKDVFDTMNVQ